MTAQAPWKVFIAEDHVPVRQRVAALLQAAGMAVVGEADTAQDAVEGIAACSPDVVVLDAQLKHGTGLDVLQAVRPLQMTVAFVVFSNSAGPAYRKRYLAEGAACFLDKSLEFESLAQAVAQAGEGLQRWDH